METPTSTGTVTQPEPLKPWKQVAEESNIFSLPPEQRLAEYDKWSSRVVEQGIRNGDFDSRDTFDQFKLKDIRTRKNLVSDDIIGPSDDEVVADYNSFAKSFQDTQRAFAADKPTPQDEAIQGEVLQGKRNAAFVRGQMVFNPAVVNDPQKYREAILESDAPADIKMFYAGLRPEMEKSATVTRRRELASNVITRDVADKVVTAIQEGTELFGMDIGTPQSPALTKNKDGVWSVVDPEYVDQSASMLDIANARYNPLGDSQYKPLPAINEYQKKYGLTDEQVQQDYMESLIENAPTTVNRWLGKATSIEDYVKQLDSTVRVKNKDVAPEVRVQDPNLFFDEQGYNAAVDKANAPDEAKNLAKAARTQFADSVAGDIYNNLLNNRDDFRENYAKDVVDRKDMEKAITRYYKDKKDQAWYDDVGEVIGQAGTAVGQGLKDLVMMPSAIKGMFGDVEAAENYRYHILAQQGEMQAEEAVANRTGGAGFIGLNNDVMRIIPDLVVQMGIAVATGGTLSGAQASLVAARTGISRAAATTALRQAAITGEKAALKSQLLRIIPEVTASTVDDVAEEVLKASARTASNNPFKGGIGTQRAVGSAYAGLTSAASTFGQVYTDVVKMGKSPEEAITTARTAGVVAGAITSGLTHSFGMLGRGGVEDFASMGRKAGEFTIRDIVNAGLLDSLTTQEGRQLMRNIAKGISKDALSEGAEEGLDQALNLISQYATNPSPEAQNRKATDVINESLYASLLGGIAGGGAASIGQARAAAPGITAQQMQAEIIGAQEPVAPDAAPLIPAAPATPVVQPSADPAVQEAKATVESLAEISDTTQTAAALAAFANVVAAPLQKPESNLPEIKVPAEPAPEVQPEEEIVTPETPAPEAEAPVNAEETPVEPAPAAAKVEPEPTENMKTETKIQSIDEFLSQEGLFDLPKYAADQAKRKAERTNTDQYLVYRIDGYHVVVEPSKGDQVLALAKAPTKTEINKTEEIDNGLASAKLPKDATKIASSPTREGVEKQITKFYAGEKKSLVPVGNGVFAVESPSGKRLSTRVIQTPKGFYFVEGAVEQAEAKPEAPARDATKPEQMTPEEFDGNDLAKAKYVEEMGKMDAKRVSPPPREFMLKAATAVAHKEALESSIKEGNPVSSAAVDAYGITLPPGYVKQGELYVYQPEKKAEAALESDYTFGKAFSDPAYLEGMRSSWSELFGKPAEAVTLSDIDRIAAKKKWSNQTKDIYIQERKPLVESAIREGKSVPPEVLADFPDLAPVKKPAKQPQPSKPDAVQKPSSDAGVLRQEGQEVGLPEVDQGGRSAKQEGAGQEGEAKPELTPEQQDVVVFIEQEDEVQEEKQKTKKRITPGKARKVGIAKQIERLGINSNDPDSVISALEKIAAKPPQKHHARIAKDLLSVLKGSGVQIQLVSGNDAKLSEGDSRVNGWFDPRTDTAYINLDGPHELGIEETILHELVHASGEKVIQNPQTEAQKRILGDLEKQMLAARKNAIALGQAKMSVDVTDLSTLIDMAASQNDYGLFDILYGVSSVSEYHAHATTSRSFQKFLATYKEGGKRSLLERFVNSITSLLSGKKTAENSDAEKAYATLLDLMREGKGDVRKSNTDAVQSRARGVSSEMDAEYLELAKDPERNAEALQQMVDEAARAAGGQLVFHGGDIEGDVIDVNRRERGAKSERRAGTFYASSNPDTAKTYPGKQQRLFFFLQNPFRIGTPEMRPAGWTGETAVRAGDKVISKKTSLSIGEAVDRAKQFGYDGVIYDNIIDTGRLASPYKKQPIGSTYVAFNSNQIKSADPVTRDDAGNVIPLSQRFQSESPDIRFSRARGIVSDTVTKYAPEFNVVDDKNGPSVFFDGRNVTVNPSKLEGLDEYEVKDLAERAVVAAKAAPKDPIAAGIIQQTDMYDPYNFDSVSRKEIRRSLAKAHAVATENGMAPLAMDLGVKLFEYGGATDAEVRKSMARGVEDQIANSDITNVPSEYSKQLAIKRAALAEKVAPGDEVIAEIISISGKYDNFNFNAGTKRLILESLREAYNLSDEFGLSEFKPYIKSWIIQNEGVLAPGASRHSTKKRTPNEENAEFEKYLEKVATSDPDPKERKWAVETAQSFVDITANYFGYTKERWHGTRSHWTVWDTAIAGGVINTALDEEVGRRYGLAGGGSRADYPIEETMFGTDDSEYEYSDGVFKRISGDYGPKKLTIAKAQELAEEREGDFYPKSFQNKRLYVKADNMLDLYTRKDELALLEILQTIDFSNAEFYQKTQFKQVLSEASKKPHSLSPNEAAGRYWPTTKNEARFGAWRDLIIPALKKAGYDGIRLRDDSHTTEAVFDAEQIKSAEPFTHDDNGELIPSSRRFNAAIPDIRYSKARGTELVTYIPRTYSAPRLLFNKLIAGFRSRGMVTEAAYEKFRDSEGFKKANASLISFIAKDYAKVANKYFGEGEESWLDFRVFSRDATGEVTVSKKGFKTPQEAESFAKVSGSKDYIVATGQDLMNKALGSNSHTLKEDVRDKIEKLTKKGLDDIANSIKAYKEEYLNYWNLVTLEMQASFIDEKQIATLKEKKQQWMKALELRAAEQRKIVDDARKEAVRAALADGTNRIIAQQEFAKAYLPDDLVYQIGRARGKIDELSNQLRGIKWLMDGSELEMIIGERLEVYVTRSYEAFETKDRVGYVNWLNEAYQALYEPGKAYDPLAMDRIMPLVRHIKEAIVQRRIEDLVRENEQNQIDDIMAELIADPRQITQVDRIPGQPIEGTEYEQLIRAVAKKELETRRSQEKREFITKAVESLGKSTFASNIGDARKRMSALRKEANRLYEQRYPEQKAVSDIMGAPNSLRWAMMTETEAHDIANVERSLSESPGNINGSAIWTSSINGLKYSSFMAAVNDDFQKNLDFITGAPTSKTGLTGATANDWKRLGDKILEHKNDVPAFLRTFLGEKDNPLLRVSDTILKQSHLVAVGELYQNLADVGAKEGWLVNSEVKNSDSKYSNWKPILNSENTDQGYGSNPFKGLYADPVMIDAINTLLAANQPSNAATKVISRIVGLSLWAVTAGSVKAIVRNLSSLGAFLLNSGILSAVLVPSRTIPVLKNVVLAARIMNESMTAVGKVSGGKKIEGKAFQLADKFWTGALAAIAAQRPATAVIKGASSMAQFASRMKENPSSEQAQEIYQLAVKLGVANDNVQKESIQRLLDIEETISRKPVDRNLGKFAKALKLDGIVGFGSYLLGTIKTAGQQRSQLYGAPDDFTKILAWLNEMDAQARIHSKDKAEYNKWRGKDGLFTDMPEEHVRRAANYTTDLIQSHSKVWAHITQFKKAGFGTFIAPFIAARAEFYRNTVNAYRIAFAEMRSDIPAEKANGWMRFASALMAHFAYGTMASAVLKMIFRAFADDEEVVDGSPEIRDAIRRLGPEYAKNKSSASVLYKNGTFDWIDISFSNPFAFVWESVYAGRRAASDADVDDFVPWLIARDVLGENLGNFVSPQIAVGAGATVISGFDPVRGIKIWDSQADNTAEKVKKATLYYLKQAGLPGDWKSAMNIYNAAKGVEENGRKYKVGTEVAGVFLGASVRTIKVTDMVEQKLSQAKDNLNARVGPLYNAQLRDSNDVDMEDVVDAAEKYHRTGQDAIKRMQRVWQAGEVLLADTPNGQKMLNAVMESDKVKMNVVTERAIKTGKKVPSTLSPQTEQKVEALGKKHKDDRLPVTKDTLKRLNQKP